jgi:hypothetical protein
VIVARVMGKSYAPDDPFGSSQRYPIIRTFLPWCMQHPPLFEAVIASVLLTLGHDLWGERTAVARRFRDQSLQKLLLRLVDPVLATDDVTLATVLTLRVVDVYCHR